MIHKKPVVYVGVVTYNSAPLIGRCLEAILGQRHVAVRVIVFDNNSRDHIARVMQRYKQGTTFIQSPVNVGFGGGHNAILRSLRLRDSDYYMALNPDARLEPGSLARLVAAAKKHRASWVSGKLYRDSAHKILYSVGHALLRDGYAFNIGFGITDRGQYNMPREVFGAPGAAALYQGSMIHTLSIRGNFFDPTLFMYYEDVDIDWRARVRGLRCWYEPSAVVVHPGGKFPRALEAEVLANRFLSVCKNALPRDLFFYNLPGIGIHIAARFLVTPRIGFRILKKFFKQMYRAIGARANTKVSPAVMHGWFLWSSKELSQQPISLTDRLNAFARRLLHA